MVKLLTARGLWKVKVTYHDERTPDIILVEYTGTETSKYGLGAECVGCGKELKNAHLFTEYYSVEDYLNGKAQGEWVFGATCIKNHVKFIEQVAPANSTFFPTVRQFN